MEHFFSNIEQTLSEKVKMRVVSQRNNFYQFFRNRYIEFLPSVISYEGLNDENVIIDPVQLEIWLRQGYGVAVGQTQKGTMVLGTVNQSNTISNIQTYGTRPLTGNDINFFISNTIKEKYYKEITYHDGYDTGNFVVLWNKPLQLTNDFNIIETYSERIAEIAMSRFSIYMQAKISTVIRAEANDEDVEQITQDLYNGAPYIKTTKFFDPDESILSINEGQSIISALPELKREYQNNIAELNNILGLSSLAVDKESGVSQTEAESNKAYQKANGNIYLQARNEKLSHYNDKYGTKLKASYRDEIASELSSLEKIQVIDGGI